jgi:hypothetical protein
MASRVLLVDQALAEYGPEAKLAQLAQNRGCGAGTSMP